MKEQIENNTALEILEAKIRVGHTIKINELDGNRIKSISVNPHPSFNVTIVYKEDGK